MRKYLARYKMDPWSKPREIKIKTKKNGTIDTNDLKHKIGGGIICSIRKYKPQKRSY